jgi:hypothetical protein
MASIDMATIGGGQYNDASGVGATIGGGQYNNALGYLATIGGGNNNMASGGTATIGGGYHNDATGNQATIGGGHGNVISPTASYGTIGGGYDNTASGAGATIGGGGWNGTSADGNQALAKAATVGGGFGNVISSTAELGTIGGGVGNTVSGPGATIGGGEGHLASGEFATIAGGGFNEARSGSDTVGGGSNNIADGSAATVGGGGFNIASGLDATVGGGTSNVASGYGSTVPGGIDNTASGSGSFAAGQEANATHSGAFVWADWTSTPFTSTMSNQFLVRAGGGVGINTADTSANALTVNGRVIAGGTGVPTGSAEPFVARGSNAGISLDDRGDATDRWVIFATGGSWRLWNGGDRLLVNSSGVVTLTALGSAGSTTLCRNAANQIATCSSSARYKNDIAALDLGLATVAALRPVTFDWNETGEPDLGFVAEEVEQVTPLLTTRNAAGQIEGVKYDRVTAVLVKAVQEQQQQIAALQQQNADLQARLANVDPNAPATWFSFSNVLSVLAVAAVLILGWRQYRSKRGQA